MNVSSDLATAALEYAARGWLVIPLHSPIRQGCSCGRRDCTRQAKHPRTPHGLKNASREAATIRGWWKRWPTANIGILTGQPSGLFVVDVDGEAGRASVADLEGQGLTLPATLTVTTGRVDGGAHLYYRMPSGVDVHNDQSERIGPHIDVRGTGGFVVGAGSTHTSGKVYRFVDPSALIADAPGWLIERLKVHPKMPTPTAKTGQVVFKHPHRTRQLTKEIGAMIRRGWPLEIIEQTAMKINEVQNSPPLNELKVIRTARDMARRYKDQGVERFLEDSAREEVRPDLICLAAVAPRTVDWLWEPYIPARMLTMISGDPSTGKSYIALAVAADLTRGRLLHGSACAPFNVLYLTAENPTAEVVRPRFDLLGHVADRPCPSPQRRRCGSNRELRVRVHFCLGSGCHSPPLREVAQPVAARRGYFRIAGDSTGTPWRRHSLFVFTYLICPALDSPNERRSLGAHRRRRNGTRLLSGPLPGCISPASNPPPIRGKPASPSRWPSTKSAASPAAAASTFPEFEVRQPFIPGVVGNFALTPA